jgi:phosphohistidine phosphatase SixA
MMHRRTVCLALPLLPSAALCSDVTADVTTALRAGACALLLRHAQTTPGTGDPPGYRLGHCATQRNLSDEGRAQARRMGVWFAQHGLKARVVQSSAWCRCTETARLAFGAHQEWPALNSFFDDRRREPGQSAALRAALQKIPVGAFEVWVTHQVNITALTAQVPAMGEAYVLNALGTMVARTTFT